MSIARIEETPEPERSLDELVRTAVAEHALATSAASDALRHAILAGEALLVARGLVTPGGWRRWVDAHLEFGVETAAVYMRIASFKDDVVLSEATSIKQARDALNVAGARRPGGVLRYDEAMRSEARALRAAGRTNSAIARELGVDRDTVARWLDPEAVARRQKKWQLKMVEDRRKAREALKRQERDKLAKAKGGNIGKAWTDVHTLAQTIDRAASEDQDLSARAALGNALTFVHKAEYEIAKALRTSKPKAKS